MVYRKMQQETVQKQIIVDKQTMSKKHTPFSIVHSFYLRNGIEDIHFTETSHFLFVLIKLALFLHPHNFSILSYLQPNELTYANSYPQVIINSSKEVTFLMVFFNFFALVLYFANLIIFTYYFYPLMYYTKFINKFTQNQLMSKLPKNNQTISIEILDKILQSFSELQYKQRQTLKKYLSEAKIKSAFIRENIIEQGMSQKKGLLILEGTMLVTKKIAKGKIVFSQINSMQFVNIQVLIYDRAHYTITVHSSQVKYIQIPQTILIILYNCIKNSISEKQKVRNKEIQQKLREIQNKTQHTNKQKMIQQLSLPALKYFSKQNKTQVSNSLNRKANQMHGKDESKIFKQNSQRSLKKQKSQSLKSKILRPIDFLPINLPKKLQIQNNNSDSPDRHERIFKQQLKSIIKRKLVYQRKQLGVLKAYRHQDNNNIIYEEGNYYAQPQNNQIDQYFKF